MIPRKLLLCALIGLAVLACDDGPTGPKEDLVVQGTVTSTQSSQHDFVVPETGLVRFTLQELQWQADDPEIPTPADLALGFGLGRPAEASCSTSATIALETGQAKSYGLNDLDYCVLLFDPGFIAEPGTYTYTLLVEF